MPGWSDVEDTLVSLAEGDLRACGEVTPCLFAMRGEEPLFIAFLRPFPPGGYVAPLTELLALACPLGADRLGLSMSGRGWSLDDPIPPVTEGADLRQRLLVVHMVDGHRKKPRVRDALIPFHLDGGDVRWGERVDGGKVEGWIPQVLRVAVAERNAFNVSAADMRAQAERCLMLGHDISWGVETAARLWLSHDARPRSGSARRSR